MAQHARSVLRTAQLLSRLSECASIPSTPIWTNQPVQLTSLSRGFAFGNIRPSNPDEQYMVISPSGGGGPVLRTPVYAIFELGGRQYKVSPGDYIYAERLKGVDVGAQLALSKVQAAGSAIETLVGRPYVEGATVTAIIEVSLGHHAGGCLSWALLKLTRPESCIVAGAGPGRQSNHIQEEEKEEFSADEGAPSGEGIVGQLCGCINAQFMR